MYMQGYGRGLLPGDKFFGSHAKIPRDLPQQ